jgi:putative ABC transport system permease protein
MRALDRMLVRDVLRLRAQGVAIALVLACGVAVILMSSGMSRALEETRAAHYDRNRFAEVFVEVNRAPRTLVDEIATVPGVAAAEARVSRIAMLDLEGRETAAMGRILSLPADGAPPRLNVPVLQTGDWPDPQATDQVVVSAPFAQANGFRPGDRFIANLNGHRRELVVTGTVLSPEFIYTIGPGAMMPDNAGFGVIWMPDRAVAAAFGMTGAFTEAALTLQPGARQADVIDAVDRLLQPYGGQGAYGRADQTSHAFIDAEIRQLHAMAWILPPVFLGITVFLVGMVMSRVIELHRAEIGLLKAIGYRNVTVAVHYLLFGTLIALVGVTLGWGAGTWLARAMARLYAEFFTFPFLITAVSWRAYAISGGLGLIAATAGALNAALRAARLAPSVAMAPPAPPHFRRGIADRVFAAIGVRQIGMMVLRGITRWPVRSGLSVLGLALATAVLVASSFFGDSLAKVLDLAFGQGNRQDVILVFSGPLNEAATAEVALMPGVLQAEGQGMLPARLRHGAVERMTAVETRRPGADLSRIVDGEGRVVTAPQGGILLSERLARTLQARPGDRIEVEFLGRDAAPQEVPVSGIVTQYFGLGAYMDAETVAALLREVPTITAVNVTLDQREESAFHAAAKAMPQVMGVVRIDANRQSFEDTIGENVLIVTTIYTVLGLVITVGVAYNGARILMSERARELASLRILGFTRAEVSTVLVAETVLLALLAQPLGWWIGYLVARMLTEGFSSDLYSVPLVLLPSTYAWASLVTLLAALGAAMVVRRRVDRLDLVAVLKTRE